MTDVLARASLTDDVSYIRSARGAIAEHARAGTLVILESTTYLGTT
jgi:UDP-N-acetyl-D-mannosaminuronate dehydrogenase